MHNFAKLSALDAAAPEARKAFGAFDKAAMAARPLPVKQQELIAIAVALTTRCPYCVEIHSKRARRAGATTEESAGAAIAAAALGAGGAISRGIHAVR